MVSMTVQDTSPATIEPPATIETTLNYLQDTGVMPSVFTGGPGSTDIRAAAVIEPLLPLAPRISAATARRTSRKKTVDSFQKGAGCGLPPPRGNQGQL